MTVFELKEKLKELPDGEEVLIWDIGLRKLVRVDAVVGFFDETEKRVATKIVTNQR